MVSKTSVYPKLLQIVFRNDREVGLKGVSLLVSKGLECGLGVIIMNTNRVNFHTWKELCKFANVHVKFSPYTKVYSIGIKMATLWGVKSYTIVLILLLNKVSRYQKRGWTMAVSTQNTTFHRRVRRSSLKVERNWGNFIRRYLSVVNVGQNSQNFTLGCHDELIYLGSFTRGHLIISPHVCWVILRLNYWLLLV